MLSVATLAAPATLTAAAVDGVLALAERAGAADGSPPLNEAALLHLRHPNPHLRHLVATLDGRTVGYAQLEIGGQASIAQLVVEPEHRRRGIGTQLAEALLIAAPTELRAWSAGAAPAAAALAARVGMSVGRELYIMMRDLSGGWPEPALPTGVELRTFRVGQDEPAWLGVNARAFSHHPEQGSITAEDLSQRMTEPWFDPAGFLVAIRGGSMVGFHWTKQHADHLGEVYVLGVDPQAAGGGLGKVLLAEGLRHLRERGNTRVKLYVESDHVTAVGLYRRYGFAVVSRDLMYVPTPVSPSPKAPGSPEVADPAAIPSQQEN